MLFLLRYFHATWPLRRQVGFYVLELGGLLVIPFGLKVVWATCFHHFCTWIVLGISRVILQTSQGKKTVLKNAIANRCSMAQGWKRNGEDIRGAPLRLQWFPTSRQKHKTNYLKAITKFMLMCVVFYVLGNVFCFVQRSVSRQRDGTKWGDGSGTAKPATGPSTQHRPGHPDVLLKKWFRKHRKCVAQSLLSPL